MNKEKSTAPVPLLRDNTFNHLLFWLLVILSIPAVYTDLNMYATIPTHCLPWERFNSPTAPNTPNYSFLMLLI